MTPSDPTRSEEPEEWPKFPGEPNPQKAHMPCTDPDHAALRARVVQLREAAQELVTALIEDEESEGIGAGPVQRMVAALAATSPEP